MEDITETIGDITETPAESEGNATQPTPLPVTETNADVTSVTQPIPVANATETLQGAQENVTEPLSTETAADVTTVTQPIPVADAADVTTATQL